MALSPKEKKELQQRFEKQLLPDLDMSFELNGEVYKFNFDKNESGDYIDSFTQAVWLPSASQDLLFKIPEAIGPASDRRSFWY